MACRCVILEMPSAVETLAFILPRYKNKISPPVLRVSRFKKKALRKLFFNELPLYMHFNFLRIKISKGGTPALEVCLPQFLAWLDCGSFDCHISS